jgi:hypothetical protein
MLAGSAAAEPSEEERIGVIVALGVRAVVRVHLDGAA